MMSEKTHLTGREELVNRVVALIFEMGDLRKTHFPPDVQYQYSSLLVEKESHEEYLRTHTDDEIEKMRFWERCDGFEKCPTRVEDTSDDPDWDKPLTELCSDIRCPDYETCWATKQLQLPGLRDLGGPPVERKRTPWRKPEPVEEDPR